MTSVLQSISSIYITGGCAVGYVFSALSLTPETPREWIERSIMFLISSHTLWYFIFIIIQNYAGWELNPNSKGTSSAIAGILGWLVAGLIRTASGFTRSDLREIANFAVDLKNGRKK